MPTVLVSILLKIAPYVIGLVALVAAYFGIKQKGVQQERQRQEAQQQKATEQLQQHIQVAVKKDAIVDAKATEAKNEIDKKNPVPDAPKPGDIIAF